jgi:peptidoglycan/xylan/chitin deacetylase (PgdA/CDA1 family)
MKERFPSICVHLRHLRIILCLFFLASLVSWWFPPCPASAARPTGAAPIALTFDLGGDAAPVPAILRALRAARVRATFFVTGRWAAAHPRLLRRIVGDGHALGNHTDSHLDLTRLPDARVAGELRRAEARVWRACGRSTHPLFRPPFGSCDTRVQGIAAALGYRLVLWSVDAGDSVKERVSAADIEERVMRRVRPGGIVLLHGGSPATAAALPRLLRALRRAGYRTVGVSQVGSAHSGGGG